MRTTLLIIIILSVFTTYAGAQVSGALAIADPSAVVLNDAGGTNSPTDAVNDDQDEMPVITFFPNPVRDNLNIRFKERGNYVIRIYNVVGAKIKEKRVQDDDNMKIDLSELPKGMYFLSFEPGNGKVITKMFTKED